MNGTVILGAIADDMTGATDLCSAFAGQGLRTVQVVGDHAAVDVTKADAVVVALKSRTAPVEQAVADSRAALGWLRRLGARQFLFKVCSTFDSTDAGNIGPVADALSDDLEVKLVPVCPSYPENGRTVYQGHLFVGDRLLSESPMADHPLTPMADSDLVRVLSRQTPRAVGLVALREVRKGPEQILTRLSELRSAGASYAILDAIDEDDILSIGRACVGSSLVVGGSGIGRGMAAASAPAVAARPAVDTPGPGTLGAPAVVLAGSCSAATREQVERMAERFPSVRVDLVWASEQPDAAGALVDAVVRGLREGAVLVYTTADREEVARVQDRLGVETAGALGEEVLAQLARRCVEAGARRVIVAGGETSGAVLRELGITALGVGRDIAPGVPWMHSLSGPPLSLALKSGNFGGPDFLIQAVEDRP